MSEKGWFLKQEASPCSSSDPDTRSSEPYSLDIVKYRSEYTFNLVMVGERNVGKTALTASIGKIFSSTRSPVVKGMYFVEGKFEFRNDIVNVKVWDIADLDISNTTGFSEEYLRPADAVLFVFDKDNLKSLDEIDDWVIRAQNHCDQCTCFALVANKLDKKNSRVYFKNKMIKSAKRFNMKTFETSAMTNEGVENMLLSLVLTLTENAKEELERRSRELDKQLSNIRSGFNMTEYLRNCLCSRAPHHRAPRNTPYRIYGPSASGPSASGPSASGPSASGPSASGPSA